jgi:hypothetical protein
MSSHKPASSKAIGLDIGTSRIVVARREDKEYQFEAQLNAFITLPHSKLTESLLQREGVFHDVEAGEIVVVGNDAQKFAEVFHVETRRPMLRGVLNPGEPHSLAVVRRIITKLLGNTLGNTLANTLGNTLGNNGAEGTKVLFSVPAPVDNQEDGLTHHEASIRQILTTLGYDASPIEEGLAVVFAELAASNYSGFGISCGSGLCNVCLAVLSVPVISFSIPKAGDFIDTHAAAVTGEGATRMRIQKEQTFQMNGPGGDRVQNALTIYHEDVIRTLTTALRAKVASTQRLPKLHRPVPVVISGGSALPKGFLECFNATLRAQEFPVGISDVRLSDDPLNATARGALMAALANSRPYAAAAANA